MDGYKITSKEFKKIASSNQYFFWHFTVTNKPWLELQPYDIEVTNNIAPNPLREIINTFKLPYYESEIEKEVNFIIQLKNGFSKRVWKPKEGFSPVIIAFKGYKLLHHTWGEFCYCSEGFIDMIYNTNPQFFDKIEI